MFSNQKYESSGYDAAQIIPAHLLDRLTHTFLELLLMQCSKLGIPTPYGCPVEYSIDHAVTALQAKYPKALDFACRMLRETPAGLRLASDHALIHAVEPILGGELEAYHVHMDGLLVNTPSSTSRLYRFHSEAHYYPMRQNFLNTWTPLLRGKTADNGAMILLPESHKKPWQFTEYRGFDDKTVGDPEHFYQYEVPAYLLREYQPLAMEIDVGATVVFDRNMLHTGALNQSDKPSYALVIRVFDYAGDLTLHDYHGDRPYQSGNPSGGGYPGLRRDER